MAIGNPSRPRTTSTVKTPAGERTFGHITVNISGGTIGNEDAPAGTTYNGDVKISDFNYSGNVYGGSMGRLTLLDGSINPLWPELAQAKTSIVNITGASTHITRNVYGGGEFGSVRENAWVTVGGSRTTVGSYNTEGTHFIQSNDLFINTHLLTDDEQPCEGSQNWWPYNWRAILHFYLEELGMEFWSARLFMKL